MGTLGSFGLAAVLLPVNATWAQKPEERQEVTIVVKSDEKSPETITVVNDAEIKELTEAVTLIDGAEIKAIAAARAWPNLPHPPRFISK